jgi:Rrf2 family protein
MKYSTRTRYGLRFLVYLALQSRERYVQLSEVAEMESISHKYLEQIVRLLRPSGLLRSQRGARGGYALAREAEKISLEEVFTYLEGDLAPVDCPGGGTDGCERYDHCTTAAMWRALEEHIRSFLRSYTLEDLAAKIRADTGTEMFYI